MLKNRKHILARRTDQNERCKSRKIKGEYGLASATKSITSILLGTVLAEKEEIDESDSVKTILAKAGVQYPNSDTLLSELLQMSSGMKWDENEEGAIRILEDASASDPEVFRDAIAKRLKNAEFERQQNGRYPFNYSGFDTQTAGLIAENLSPGGETLSELFHEVLWKPIKAGHKARWKADFSKKSPAAFCCLYMSDFDFAKIGQWVLKRYKTTSDAPEGKIGDWLRKSTTDTVPTPYSCGADTIKLDIHYGYQWWILSGDDNGFTALGKGGQFLHIFPKQDVVVVQLSAQKRHWKTLCEAMQVHRALAYHVSH